MATRAVQFLQLLEARDRVEKTPFQTIIAAYNDALGRESLLRKSNAALLDREKNRSSVTSESGQSTSGSSSVSDVRVKQLEMELQQLQEKSMKLQEELTEMYRAKSSHAEAVLDLTGKVQKNEKHIDVLTQELAAAKTTIEEKEKIIREHEDKIAEVEALLATGTEELREKTDALVTLEQQVAQLKSENKQLIDRWMTKIAQEAEKMNEVNELWESAMEKKKQIDLLEQVKDEVDATVSSEHQLINNAYMLKDCISLPTEPKFNVMVHKGAINSLTYNSSGSTIVSGGDDNAVKLINSTIGCESTTLNGAVKPVMSASISLQDEFILGCSNDNAARIWNAHTCRVRHTLTGHQGKVLDGTFSTDGKHVMTGSSDRTIKVWDLMTGYCLQTTFCISCCNSLAVSLDNQLMCSGHFDCTVRLWTASKGEEVQTLSNLHTQQVTNVRFSPDGTYLLTASRDSTLKVLDIRTFQTLYSLSHKEYKNGINWSKACWSPNGQYIAAGSADGIVFIWNTKKGKFEKALTKGHKSAVIACAWSPLGDQFVSGDKDSKIVIWDVDNE
eukprot:GFYU01004095.1.p1 GENE.GFYU01004095.1~~GFYU01004095.1.p1  ORF type:complete len:558 (+),score=175.92 GFYU01004095.1:142-1815(+)